MIQSRFHFGSLGLLLLAAVCIFPSPAHATISPISFYDYSLVDTVTTNSASGSSATKSQTLSGPPPTGPQSGTVTQNNPTSSAPSKSSITAGVNPTDILRPFPVASTSTNISIAQTVTALGLAPLAHSFARANSAFSADFKGTGNYATFYVNYFAGGITTLPHHDGDFDFDSFSGSLVLTVTNMTTHAQLGFLDVNGNNNEGGEAFLVSSSGFSQFPNPPGLSSGYSSSGFPFFTDFATQSNDLYQISGDMSSSMYGSPSTGGTGLSTFDLVANTPEPSTLALFGTGILLMGVMVSQRRKTIA